MALKRTTEFERRKQSSMNGRKSVKSELYEEENKRKSKIVRRTMLTGVPHDMDHLHFILIFEIENVEHNAKLKTLSHVKIGISVVIYFILRIFCIQNDVFNKQLFYSHIKLSHIRCYHSKKI